MSGRHESFTAEYCTGETVTLYSQQHHTRIHLQTHTHANNHIPLNQKGEPIKLPDNLESLPRAEHFPVQRHRWNTNEEIAAILINFERHSEWQSKEVKIRPKSGSMLLYSRKKVRYRRDGYCWKKRKDGKTTREDHMKLKVQGTECIYGCYVHSAILPTFHRRCYWLLQNPDMVLVHYLNVPYPDDNKLSVISPSLALWADRKEWTKDELLSQLKPMFYEEDPDLSNEMEVSTAECVAAMVTQLMEWQKNARATLLSRTLECGCPDSTCADGQSCSRPIRRISPSDSNQVSSTTGNRSRTGTMLLTNHHVNSSRNTMNTLMIANHANHKQVQSGPTSLNTSMNNNLLSNSTRDFRNQPQQQQPQQQQIILKHDCRDNNQILNNRQASINVTDNNHIPTTMISYKPQGSDEVIHVYTEKQTYHTSQNQDEHAVHLFHGQDHLKQQSDQVKSEFYDVTLDLSHDDIQQTLSANMPLSCANADQLLRLDDDHNNKNLDGTGDDVFVSLDAFDMLTDFQELDILEHATQNASNLVTEIGTNAADMQPHAQTQLDNMDVLQITDYCPEWAFPEGGVKVLITGPWFSSSSYTVMFDTITVPSTLIQGGVLRCYCPAHDIGTVTLQVVIDGRPVSTTAIFEYRQHEFPLTISSLSMSHTSSLLKFHLLQKLDSIEDYLQSNNQQTDQPLVCKDSIVMFSKPNFEDQLVNYCEKMKQFSWKSESEYNLKQLETETTILHMAAFLGYSKLVCILLQWKLENVSLFLEMEVNVSKQDREGYTPLMWACKKGHKDTAVLLCQWYQTVQNSNNNFNQDYSQPDILESVHQYFNDFNQNQYCSSENLSNDVFLRPDGINSDVKKEIDQTTNQSNNLITPANKSVTILCSKGETTKSDKNEIKPQETQGSKRPLPNSFFQTDDYYDQFCKPSLYFPSIQKFQKSLFLPLQSPTSDSGNSSEKSPVLSKSDFIIWEHDVRVLTLAEQFIAAMPDHIKNENGSHGKIVESSVITMEVLDDPPSSVSSCCFDTNSEINTEFNEHVYHYRQKDREIETPTSSTSLTLSPVSSASQCSPASPPPTAADLCEFLHASSNNQYFEKNFSNLTLSDYEQRELYEAAKTIQKAYRTYKKKEEDKEISAASIIQNYYRRYKQYAYYKQMTKAAILIQNKYRVYRRHKRFKKEAAHYINNTFTVIKKNQNQKRQNQAARKIQQFMRQSKNGTSPPATINERTFGSRKREANGNHNMKYPPTKVAQYSTLNHH
ncbi:calmodulin-binding transcription activator 1 isoform X6 [Aphis gossypii]|uniref:calmodulin-binding transcription activator 1 isoform X6 n=1 Tax=Aphis gossypii TaxID=80765 RepID=UPI0021593922|nr:calmodulin-binding transcription activator 1 isoform X6 [Aphis gossypii]